MRTLHKEENVKELGFLEGELDELKREEPKWIDG